ncbi:DUF1270 family protein, partial [Staphylococcus aureus]
MSDPYNRSLLAVLCFTVLA